MKKLPYSFTFQDYFVFEVAKTDAFVYSIILKNRSYGNSRAEGKGYSIFLGAGEKGRGFRGGGTFRDEGH